MIKFRNIFINIMTENTNLNNVFKCMFVEDNLNNTQFWTCTVNLFWGTNERIICWLKTY